MPNLIVLNPQRGDSIALTAVTSAYKQPSAFQLIGQTVYSTASIPANANNALYGKAITISGFAAAGNNGTFAVLASTATSITVNNATGVVVAAAGTATFQTTGTPAQYASKVENLWSNQNGDNVTVNAGAGDTLIAVVIGLKSFAPFDLLHGTAPYGAGEFVFGQLQGLNDFNANPTITDGSSEVAAISNIAETAVTNIVTLTVATSNFAIGESVTLAGLTTGTWLNGHTVTLISPVSATTLTFVDPTAHGLQASHAETGTATESGGNVWSLVTHSNIIDSDYTVSSVPPPYTAGPFPPAERLAVTRNGVTTYIEFTFPPTTPAPATNPYPSSKWNIDGFYPSIYVFVASNVQAGSYKVNLNSMYQPGDANNTIDYSQGALPIFDGGVNLQVFNISGAAATAAVDASSISLTETVTNPATAPATLTTTATDGDLLLSIGLLKNGNTFAPGTTGGTAISEVLSAVAPLAAGGAVYTGTITGGANNAFAGYSFTVAGFTHASNNGVFIATGSTATTITLLNGSAITESHAATAAYVAPMTRIGSGKLVNSEAHYIVEYALTAAGSAGVFNPGFQNPLGYPMLVASVAIKSA